MKKKLPNVDYNKDELKEVKVDIDLNDPDVELTEEDLANINKPETLLEEVKKDLYRTKKYIDKKIFEAEVKSQGYDKFSQAIFLTKLELAKEKRQILETLADISIKELKFEKEIEETDSITDFLSK